MFGLLLPQIALFVDDSESVHFNHLSDVWVIAAWEPSN